ncbi:MAG: hypothetical protein KBT03_11280 [Bacteroidales bacterium]|nr:hypothetical protein [Candidatus Scybalousia scybalohippi]
MFLDFSMKGYNCAYKAGKEKIEGVCFSRGYSGGVRKNKGHVVIRFTRDKQQELNYCFLSYEDMIAYSKWVADKMGFKIISINQDKKYNYIQIEFNHDNRYFLFIVTLLRYVYEFPFNVMLYSAWKHRNEYPELNIVTLFQMYLGLFFNGRLCHNIGQENVVPKEMHPKCLFNYLRNNFNRNPHGKEIFKNINSKYYRLIENMEVLNTKQIDEYADFLNNIVTEWYNRNKNIILGD